MFKIGEFSKIAQVSGRLLRYYDEIGLLKPKCIDTWNGYRFYTADQLPRLNRILALKELGLSLEQIEQLLDDNIDTDNIRDLYLERKAQIEQSLREELARLQQVQLRLNQLDHLDQDWMPDIVIKQIPAQTIFAYRDPQMSEARLYQLFEALVQNVPKRVSEKSDYGSLLTILHSDTWIPEADMDLEIGLFSNHKRNRSLSLEENVMLTEKELPAVERMATIIHQGLEDHPITYNALGRWLEKHQYQIVGHSREILIENHYPDHPENCILEIQFPVERIEATDFNLQTIID